MLYLFFMLLYKKLVVKSYVGNETIEVLLDYPALYEFLHDKLHEIVSIIEEQSIKNDNK